jgi:serine/threonine protein kinase
VCGGEGLQRSGVTVTQLLFLDCFVSSECYSPPYKSDFYWRRVHEGRAIGLAERLAYGVQIARGMEYLAAHHIIHRDLAARNCLVSYPPNDGSPLGNGPLFFVTSLGKASSANCIDKRCHSYCKKMSEAYYLVKFTTSVYLVETWPFLFPKRYLFIFLYPLILWFFELNPFCLISARTIRQYGRRCEEIALVQMNCSRVTYGQKESGKTWPRFNISVGSCSQLFTYFLSRQK